MFVSDVLLSSTLLLFANLIACLGLGFALWKASWRMIFEVPLRQHLLFATVILLVMFWSMDFEVLNAISLHFSMMASATLVLGLRFSVICASIAMLGYLLIQSQPWQLWGVNLLINVWMPALFISFLVWLMRRLKPTNLFFYTLGIGFFGSALTIPCVLIGASIAVYLSGYSLFESLKEFEVAWIFLAMFPEAFLNGVVVSSITVFYPEWMKTFDEEYFLSR
ncbi:energy-coupling factor ABC transporter permease [Pleionea sp. CnH1-48]|uniref:energy-coupling factor ABC transporter permease n=1 Tax=Pleionea sp. CnH1-48 TaxID=2954494 RepID=UPI002097A258|nr:energy-coupling factor ABC transporter permease [Pleionea sp. CnH1-48]MCO7226410.1 energy-coupling factor ABC transporter permease [Pleionea sp. CnH1-48]